MNMNENNQLSKERFAISSLEDQTAGMYHYDQYDQTLIEERAAQYRDQTQRYLAGELGADEFLALRLMNGLYVQTHAPMLRVAVPYGLLSSRQLHKLAHIARTYDKEYAHVSTRQNFQFNWPSLESVPDILEELATVQMHAIQTSGNCIRSVTSDPLAGIAADELEDPRPYCEILRQWSSLHPEFAYLPRKFKLAVSGAQEDRAATLIHDIGLRLVKNSEGDIGFQVSVGGGLGRTPVIGKRLCEFLQKKHLLSYLDAILRIYNLYGRRDNKYKARIKILVNSLGIDRFRELVEVEWQHSKESLLLEQSEIDRVKTFFAPPIYTTEVVALKLQTESDPAFKAWLKHNVKAHKVSGYRAVFISLKATGNPPGDISAQQMESVANLAEQYSFGLLRTTHDQNILLSDVKQSDLYALWQTLATENLATPNIGTLNDMICCPGLDFCALANTSSIDIAKSIQSRFERLDYLYDIGEIDLKMSGCMNGCAHHDIGHIGILGVDKKGEEWYQITLGGFAKTTARLTTRLGRAIAKERVVDTVETIIQVYLKQRLEGERFIDTFLRIGIEPFREQVYGK